MKNKVPRMARAGITYLNVANSAQQLMASGHEPTIERIRADLKTGSNSTIGTHLRAWRANQDPLQQLATKEKIPEELIVLLKGLWERVMDQAEVKIAAIQKEAEQNHAQHQQTLKQLQQDNTRLQQAEAQLKQARDHLIQEKMTLEHLVAKSHTEIATLQTKYDGILQQLDREQMIIEKLHKQNQQVQANLEHYHAASLEQRNQDLQRAELQQRELTHALSQFKLENEALKQQTVELQGAHEKLHVEQKNGQAERDKITLHCEIISTQLSETQQALAEKTATQRHWETQYNELNAKWETQTKITVELRMQQAVLLQQLTTAKEELEEISAQNRSLSHDRWALGQEKAQLFGQLKQLQTVL
jgi:Plasmid replication region DNA-binding N-term